jgi:DNA repair protein RadC
MSAPSLFQPGDLVDASEGMAADSPAYFDLQERAVAFGADALSDRQALAVLLTPWHGQAAEAVAARLLAAFGGELARALCAPLARLEPLVGRPAAVALLMVRKASERLAGAEVTRRTVITSWTQLTAYLRPRMAWEGQEQFRVLFLDRKNCLIADEIMNRGTVDHAPVYPREVMRRALELDASAVILAHNHPSGDPTPSKADIDMTREVIEAGRALKITVHDHVIAAAQGMTSLRTQGLI